MSVSQVRSLQDSVEAQFSATAENYRLSAVHAAGEDLTRMLIEAELRGDEIVLDAGCGAGHASVTFAPHAAQVVAYDLSTSMLEQVRLLAAERGLLNIDTRQGSVESLPFEAGTFSVVISRYSAHHWAQPQVALREFARVLKVGGKLILSDIASSSDPLLDTWLQTLELIRDPSHVRDHSVAQWLQMFQAAGFSATTAYEWTVALDFASWVQRMNTPQSLVEALGVLMVNAPAEVRSAFRMTFDEGLQGRLIPVHFSIPGALFVGRRVEQST